MRVRTLLSPDENEHAEVDSGSAKISAADQAKLLETQYEYDPESPGPLFDSDTIICKRSLQFPLLAGSQPRIRKASERISASESKFVTLAVKAHSARSASTGSIHDAPSAGIQAARTATAKITAATAPSTTGSTALTPINWVAITLRSA